MPKILISYRRSDTTDIVGRIFDRLVSRYGPAAVFLDIDNIPYAVDFRDHIRNELADSDVLLAVVGRDWLGTQPNGSVRMNEKKDPVRVEVETAMQLGVLVLPVLVNGATMPAEGALPKSLSKFPYLNAAEVSSGRDFDMHVARLIRELEKILQLNPLPADSRTNAAGTDSAPSLLRFADLAASLRLPSTWAITALVVLPIAAWLATLAPGWPSGIVIMTIAAALAVLWSVYRWLRAKTPAAMRRVAIAATAAMIVFAFTYLLILPVLTYQAAPSDNRWARGFVCTPEAVAVYKDKCPHLSADQLRQAEFVAERLWTEQSIAVVRSAVIALWLSMFLAIAVLLAALLARQHGDSG